MGVSRRNRKRTCDFPECGRPHEAYGWCNGHYQQFQKGQVLKPLRVRGGRCSVPGCTNPNYGNDLCCAHYQQNKRGQEFKTPRHVNPKNISLDEYITRNIVVRDSGCWEWRHVNLANGYARWGLGVKNKTYGRIAYREVWNVYYNTRLRTAQSLDHLCRNKLCVNPAHLEVVSARENTKRMLAYTAMADELATLRTENAALRAELERISGAKAA